MPYERCLRCGHRAVQGRRFIVSVSIMPDTEPADRGRQGAEGGPGWSLAEAEELAFFLCARCKSRFVADPGGQDPDVPVPGASDHPQVLH